MQWPHYYISQIACKKHSFKPISSKHSPREIFHTTFENSPSKVPLLLFAVSVVLVAQHIKQINCPGPPRYLTQTAHASISSNAFHISKCYCLSVHSVGAFWEPRAPLMCVSACRERPLCTMFTFFPNSVHLSGLNVPRKLCDPLCPSLFKEDVNTLLAATLIAVIPPFSFFCCNILCLYLFISSMQILCVLCVFVLFQWFIVCLCMAPETFHAT